MSRTRKIVGIGVSLGLLAMAVAIKLIYFPTVKDAYFAMDQASLQHAPFGLDVIRPTHFSLAVFRRGIIYTPVKGNRTKAGRLMGRDVSLRDIIAVAWHVDAARIQMPPGAPTNNFDFIVTVSDPLKRLQKAIRSKFGYTAEKKMIETHVLAMKVENPALPGMAVSAADEKENASFKDSRLYITHMRLKELTTGFEQILKSPVVDKTGLTNCYDFSVEWDTQFLKRLQNESTARPELDKLLDGWGLGLEPDTETVDTLVIRKES
jgi:uncharacterized protein (TIGR03435 family)